jgi:hydrogenase maturation protein HypF
MNSLVIAKRIDIDGIVQGVGFRPFIYQLARLHGLNGQVVNTAEGVTVHLEGPVERIGAFLDDLPRKKPPLARIIEIRPTERPVQGYEGFSIAPSRGADQRATLISPDAAVCEECLRELFDPGDRRFHYPFINCTNCGPRYTIIDDIPYDRPKTAMRHFTMCALCQAEYDDPDNRRFHAQPNACALCGPQVALFDHRRGPVDGDDPIAVAARLIKEGHIVAVKGLGGFHLAVDAHNDAAVARLRRRKLREEKPLAVMSPDLDTIAGFACFGPAEAELLTAIQRPIVLLPKRLPEKLAFEVAPRNHYYGVMLPYTPLHHLLLAQGLTALVMTSANRSDEPIAIDNDDAFERLAQIADYFLVHDRGIYLRSDDSIVRHAAGQTRFVRRSRGYVPVPIFIKPAIPPVLACGAELKNTICLTRGRQAFVSQHIGDLENPATEDFFRLTIAHLKRILDIRPELTACDRHPDYLSTQWAKSQVDVPVVEVQHHHAHLAAVMAEHQLEGPLIGLAFDGTGLGDDGTIWGGEIMLADTAGYRRVAALEAMPMPGGAAAIKEPWRMGLAYLHAVFGDALWELDLPLLRGLDRGKAEIIVQMASRRINAPLTSSLGRLFDGVASIIGLRRQAAYEGQAAMELEMIADGREHAAYDFEWGDGPCRTLRIAPLIRALVADVQDNVPAFIVSRKFHQTIIGMCAAVCALLRAETHLTRIVLSGGCFQNVLLLGGLTQALRADRFEVFTHRQVPTNDGGLALGQALVAGSLAAGLKSEVSDT